MPKTRRMTTSYPRVLGPGESASALISVSVSLARDAQATVTFYDDGTSHVALYDLRVGPRTVNVDAYLDHDGRPREDLTGHAITVENGGWSSSPVSDYHRRIAVRRVGHALVTARGMLTAAWLSQPYETATTRERSTT